MSPELRLTENSASVPPVQGGVVAAGYLAAVSAATACFATIEIGVVLWAEGLRGLAAITIVALAAIIFWFVACITAILPVTLAYAAARWLRIRSIYYYLACGAVTGAMLSPLFVAYGWDEDDPVTFSAALRAAPMFMVIGACGAAMFWYIAGRHIACKPATSLREQ